MRVGLISRWHVHSHAPDERYVKEFLSVPGCSVTCVWDKDQTVARKWAEEYGVDAEESLESLLSRDDVDGVIVTSEAADHKEIFLAAAAHKKHIFTEKVLSFTVEEANEIRDAIKKSGVKFCISFMRLGIKQLAYARTVLESGEIGEAVQFRCLCGHRGGLNGDLPDYWFDPAICGGGAMIDLGFNSAYLARYIMGRMTSVSSVYSDRLLGKRVEDNAICSVTFENGAIGTIESTFTSPCLSVFELAVYGTKGAYYARFGGDGTAQLNVMGKGLRTLTEDEIPAELDTPMKTWINAVEHGASDEVYGIDAAVDMVRYMVAAYRSHAENGKRTVIE